MKKLFILFLPFFFAFIPMAFAQNDSITGKTGEGAFINLGPKQTHGIPAFNNPNASVGNLIANALQIMFIFGVLAVLVFLIWGAFDWVTSGGDKEKVSAARRKITNALIGLALLALSIFIVTLVGEIAGINPLNMGLLPTLGQQPQAIQPPAGTTP